jgi:DNA polymerase III subunit delta'
MRRDAQTPSGESRRELTLTMPFVTVDSSGLLPLIGHNALRERLSRSARDSRLPASLLLHGTQGIGKQRLALWLGALLLCERSDRAPCGSCAQCRLTLAWRHPDLLWFFPRPRLKDSDPSSADIMADLAEGTESRIAAGGLYPPASSTDALFVASVRALVRAASGSPAMAARRVFVIGDAERLVPQEGADAAANAFLKLLEEPPRNTWLLLTSSEPSALLPTIRSRVVAVRVAPPSEESWRVLLAEPAVASALEQAGWTMSRAESVPIRALGELLAGRADGGSSVQAAELLLRAALSPARADGRATRARAAFVQGVAGARASFAGTLDALTELIVQESRTALGRGDAGLAERLARTVIVVERAQERTASNANPMLLAAALLQEMEAVING